MPDVVVLITATIHCGQTPQVMRRDPHEREQDYLKAFQSWITSGCNADVVFCENSNADLSKFTKIAMEHKGETRVHCLSFAGNAGAEVKGKGYGEIEMLRYALEALPELGSYRYILKVSGRYEFKNGKTMVEQIGMMTTDLVCDIHTNLTYGDTKTVAFTPRVATEHLIPFQEELDENAGVIIEHLMARCLHRTLLAGGTWAPLPCTPFSYGISGSWNTPQRDTLIYRFKQSIKRKIAAWIYRY